MLTDLVQLREGEQGRLGGVLVHDAMHDRGYWGEEEVEEYHEPVVDHGRAWEPAEELVPEQQSHIRLGNQGHKLQEWEAIIIQNQSVIGIFMTINGWGRLSKQ